MPALYAYLVPQETRIAKGMPEMQVSLLEQAKMEAVRATEESEIGHTSWRDTKSTSIEIGYRPERKPASGFRRSKTIQDGETMNTIAVYCRVSSEGQEREGTSLQTQLEACLRYCRDKGYDARYRFTETYSGLVLERPALNELRELVRNDRIEAVIAFSLDRISRDPSHGVILSLEMEKHGVKLETVTEDTDNSELGKLISYIRGFASKLEAAQIRERTLRGRRARAKEGRVSGGFHITYGYDYIPVNQKNGGRRVVNEIEARWVRQIFQWLVDGGLATGAIRDRLAAAGAPTKTGKPWHRGTVIAIAKNPAYAGKTYAFTSANGRARRKPREEWIELPDVTPPIISQEVFDAAQKQLQVNSAGALRNTKREYLLRGHVRCRRCGHAYVGGVHGRKKADGSYTRIYTCCARTRDRLPEQRCGNKIWNAHRLETLVWTKLEEYMRTPVLVAAELENQRKDLQHLGVYESQLEDVRQQLKVVDREQHQLLQWALKGFPENQVEAENERLNKARETLTAQIMELEGRIKVSRDAVINIPNLERFIGFVHSRTSALDYESRRVVLDMINITVWIDGESVELMGVLDPECMIATTYSYEWSPFPAGRDSRVGATRCNYLWVSQMIRPWIPACAGMTRCCKVLRMHLPLGIMLGCRRRLGCPG